MRGRCKLGVGEGRRLFPSVSLDPAPRSAAGQNTLRPRSLLQGLYACRCKCGRERCSPRRTAGSAAGAGRPARARREGRRWRLTAPTCRLRLARPAAAPPTRTAASLLSRRVRPRVPVGAARSRRAEHRPRTAAAERQRCHTNRTSTSASREQAPHPPSRSHPLLPTLLPTPPNPPLDPALPPPAPLLPRCPSLPAVRSGRPPAPSLAPARPPARLRAGSSRLS